MNSKPQRVAPMITGILVALLLIPVLSLLKESGALPEPIFSFVILLLFPGLIAAAKLLYDHQTVLGSIVFVTVQAAYWLLVLWLWQRYRRRARNDPE